MTNKEYLEKVRDVCEELGWIVDDYNNGVWYISQFTPLGEDFGFEVQTDDISEEIRKYSADFDPEEHVEFWIKAKNESGDSSVPGVFELCDDAKALDKMLEELAIAVIRVEW